MFITFKCTTLLYSLGRTGSVYFTILVAVERYFVVVHPFKAKAWLNSRRPCVITVVWFVLILLINLPWWLNSVIASQTLPWNAKGPLGKYPTIFVSTVFGRIYSRWLRRVHVFIDFVLPLPLLLLFNGMLYWHVRNLMMRSHFQTNL